jgi:hypothetical protein
VLCFARAYAQEYDVNIKARLIWREAGTAVQPVKRTQTGGKVWSKIRRTLISAVIIRA